jgi:hypothetical protein
VVELPPLAENQRQGVTIAILNRGAATMPVSLPAQLIESVKSNEAFALATAMLAGAAFPNVLDDARVIPGLLTSSPATVLRPPSPGSRAQKVTTKRDNSHGDGARRRHLPHKERAAVTQARDKAILDSSRRILQGSVSSTSSAP